MAQPGIFERAWDHFIWSAIHSPLGGGGVARFILQRQGHDNNQINQAIGRLDQHFKQKYQDAPTFQVRKGHPFDYVSPDNIGRAAVDVVSNVLGGVDPTYAIAPGRGALQRIVGQGLVQGPASVVRQGINVKTGMQKKISATQAAKEAATAMLFQSGVEGVRGVHGMINSGEKPAGPDMGPDGGPAGPGPNGPEGPFGTPKEAAHHIIRNDLAATHDIVAHNDGSYSVEQVRDHPVGHEPAPKLGEDAIQTDAPEAPEAPVLGEHPIQTDAPDITDATPPAVQEAPLAPDGLPGNGSVRPIDPSVMANIMGDPAAAAPTLGVHPIQTDAPDVANLPDTSNVIPHPASELPDVVNPGTDPIVNRQNVAPQAPLNQGVVDTPLPANDSGLDRHDADMNEKGFVRSVVDGRWLTRDEAYDEAHQQWIDKNFPEGTVVHGYGHNIDEHGNYKPDEVVKAIEDQDSELAKARQRKLDGEDPFPAKEEIQTKPGVNAYRLAKMTGQQMYGDPSETAHVSIKEVLQNSFDAIKDAMHKHGLEKGKIDITTDRDARTITMHDNGIGMTPETLGTKFLQIAGTGKEGGNSSGGFGIAKMQFLYGNKDLHVVTMRDGKVAELKTTGDDLFDSLEDPSKAPMIKVRNATEADHELFPHGHGTRISLTIPKDYKDNSGETHEVDFPYGSYGVPALGNSPLFAPIEVTYDGYPVSNVGTEFPAHNYNQFAHVKLPWGKADIYVSRHSDKVYGTNVHVLSNGLWQFDKKLGKNPGDPWSEPLPYTFYIDVHPHVKPEDNGYPFTLNRQGFTDKAGKELNNILDYIQKLYAVKDIGDSAKSFGTLTYIDPHTGQHSNPIDITPDIPVMTDGFRGIQEGDEVSVRDGRMFVNGRELPALTPEELKNSVPKTEELKVNPALIDTQRIMVHDNATVDFNTATSRIKRKGRKFALRDQRLPDEPNNPDAEDPYVPPASLVDHMRQEFGSHFDNMLRDVGGAFLELRNMVAGLGEQYHGLLDEGVGVSFDPAYRGVSIRVPFSGSFVNPLVPEGTTPLEQAYGIIGTMIHELAHHQVRSHNADFPAEMQRLMYKLYADPNLGYSIWQQHVADRIAKYDDVIEYGKKLFDEKHVKATSDSFKDGVRHDRPDGSDEGNADGVSQSGDASPSAEGISDGAEEGYPTLEPGSNPGKFGRAGRKDPVVAKLADILEQGAPLRRENAGNISRERAERFRKAMLARKNTSGRKGLYAELAALKGDMSKAYIQPIVQHFTPDEIDHLIDMVKHDPRLRGFASIRAARALDKLFGEDFGELPTEGELKLLQKVLPKSVTKNLLSDESGSLSTAIFDNIADPVANVLAIPRAMKTMGDFGVAFRQAVPLIGTKAYWSSFKHIFTNTFSEQAWQDNWNEITERPTYYWMQQARVAFTNLGDNLSEREEFAASKLAEHIPGVRASERGYTGFLNKVRADTFDRLFTEGQAMGIDVHDPKYLKQLGNFVNVMTGRGSLGKTGDRAAPFLAAGFFSPRLNASRLQMLFNPMFYIRLPNQLKWEAAKALFAYTTYLFVVLGVAAALGAKVERDLRSTKFGRIQIGDTVFDVSGSIQPYVRTMAQLIAGQKKTAGGQVQDLGDGYGKPTRLDVLTNFIEGKASPVASFVMDELRGKDLMHPKNIVGETNSFDQHALNNWFKNPAVSLFTPMPLEAGLEAGAHYGWDDPAMPAAAATAEMFGIGANTYEPHNSKSHSSKPFSGGFKKSFGGSSFKKAF